MAVSNGIVGEAYGGVWGWRGRLEFLPHRSELNHLYQRKSASRSTESAFFGGFFALALGETEVSRVKST